MNVMSEDFLRFMCLSRVFAGVYTVHHSARLKLNCNHLTPHLLKLSEPKRINPRLLARKEACWVLDDRGRVFKGTTSRGFRAFLVKTI